MFGVVRRYKTEPGQIAAILRHMRERFMHPISQGWGFVSWTLIDAGPAGVVTASVFDNELGAELAAGWVRENQAATALGQPEVRQGPILFRDVKEHVRSGFGFVWRYTCKPGTGEEVTKRVRDDYVPLASGMSGYAAYGAIDAGRGVTVWLLVFADEDSAHAAEAATVNWADKNLAGLLVQQPELFFGEIKLRIPAAAMVTA
jgi:hypothetical protein